MCLFLRHMHTYTHTFLSLSLSLSLSRTRSLSLSLSLSLALSLSLSLSLSLPHSPFLSLPFSQIHDPNVSSQLSAEPTRPRRRTSVPFRRTPHGCAKSGSARRSLCTRYAQVCIYVCICICIYIFMISYV